MSKYIVKIEEKSENTHEYQENGYNRTYIADDLNDACEFLKGQEGANSRFFDYSIEEVSVI